MIYLSISIYHLPIYQSINQSIYLSKGFFQRNSQYIHVTILWDHIRTPSQPPGFLPICSATLVALGNPFLCLGFYLTCPTKKKDRRSLRSIPLVTL